MCMPLKPATTRDCGGGVQFNAAITGISTTLKKAAVNSLSVPQARAGIRNTARPQ